MERVWQLGNIFSLLVALVANVLIGAQVLDLPSISSISDSYATLLTPAGYAFSIWSLIYLLLIVFVVFQARDIVTPRADNTLPVTAGPFFIIANLCNALWLYVFVTGFIGFASIVLLALTTSLYVLLWRLKIATDNPPFKVILTVWWPLLIYTGWVTIASIVNIASWLSSIGVTVTPLIASGILLGFGAALLIILYKRNVRELLLACAWGVAAIGVEQLSGSQLVATAALLVAGLLLIAVTAHAYINRQSNPLQHLKNK